MSTFTFLHAADLHLDSPLLGLSSRAPDFAEKVEDASRRALDALVALAIEEECRFVLFAGDVFDGDLRNVKTGLYFVSRMRELADAGIEVFAILGNHDAENRFMSRLEFSPNVHLFPTKAAATLRVEGLDVAIHGRSFPQRDVFENIAQDYPPPTLGAFNVGMLHTALVGREGEHARYAPCSLEQLKNHGYDYWALGHVHEAAVLSEAPHVVYPGNVQGRSMRETGPKGVVLVSVVDGQVADVQSRPLDAVRFAQVSVDVGDAADMDALVGRARAALEATARAAEGRPVALRLRLAGASPLHGEIALRRGSLREEIEALAATVAGDVWLEKLSLATTTPVSETAAPVDPSIAGQIRSEIATLAADPELAGRLDAILAELRAKLPAGARPETLLDQIRAEAPARAAALAQALVGEGGADDALR